ncbi:unknown protein [Bathycoccus prasinos]|uniref:Uncharacterized protein n=1 Tax=Bathycoccus prasinos TaxID=41875 RepID=K8ES30_9CHLO|nr:unknown protein [Bathycoccus prasinos]CCO20764.1 unknown protein [Bathycoccus prasinos]|eukprot:XP_007508045.1 unknown protein [Bathycoccus prasinos]
MQKLLVRTRALGKQVSSLSLRLNAFEKFFEDTITTRFEETNGFIFEVLTALSDAPRCVHPFLSTQPQRGVEKNKREEIREGERAPEEISAASDSAEQKKQISTKPKKMSSKEKASMGLCFREAVTLDDFLDGYNTQVNLPPSTTGKRSRESSATHFLTSRRCLAIKLANTSASSNWRWKKRSWFLTSRRASEQASKNGGSQSPQLSFLLQKKDHLQTLQTFLHRIGPFVSILARSSAPTHTQLQKLLRFEHPVLRRIFEKFIFIEKRG